MNTRSKQRQALKEQKELTEGPQAHKAVKDNMVIKQRKRRPVEEKDGF